MTKQTGFRVEFRQNSLGAITEKAPASVGGRYKELPLIQTWQEESFLALLST